MSTADVQKLSAVSTRLLEDHKYIRFLLSRLQASLQDICHRQSPQGLQAAQESIRDLERIMTLHAAREERVVFPALSPSHPVLALEAEHDELTLRRAALQSGILSYSFPEDCTDDLYTQYAEFIQLLQRHLVKEEVIIFPLIEELSAGEEQRLLREMENIS